MTGRPGATARLLAVLRTPWVRWGFLVLALGLAVYAVVAVRDDLLEAARAMSAGRLAAALGVSLLFVAATMMSWRAVLTDLGSRLGTGSVVAVFGISQLGKYVPGGVWNIVAAAEVGADHGVPRRRTMTATAVATGVGVVSGAVVGAVALPFLAADALGPWGWTLWLLPAVVVLLLPPVLNRLLALALRVARRAPLEHPLSWRGLGAATAWAVLGWVCAGLQVWLLATGLGMATGARTFALAVGGYALAWMVGFLVVVVPAGAGARELVLLAVLAGTLPHAELLLVVLVSRALVTLADLAFAGAGAGAGALGRRGPLPPLAPRARLRWDAVRRTLPRERARVLEVGCGQGAVGARIAARHDYTAVELDETTRAVAAARVQAVAPGARVVHGGPDALGTDERFDVVCAFEVVEHVADDAAALAEWVDRLRPGGLLLLSTPAWPERFGPWDTLAGHYRRYDPERLRTLLLDAGLSDVDVRLYDAPLGYLLEAVRNRVARRRARSRSGAPVPAEQTAVSGRVLQPTSWAAGALVTAAVWPFCLLQRALPHHGTGIVAHGRRPTPAPVRHSHHGHPEDA
ncbi:methyltransferase domain-containing protein [Isoptericola halotolerans]|uniref:methyltransferase domain-containing protein n=1 Tax=Isoptericola halotolerans TaxID=300560 RepID=UPI0038910334